MSLSSSVTANIALSPLKRNIRNKRIDRRRFERDLEGRNLKVGGEKPAPGGHFGDFARIAGSKRVQRGAKIGAVPKGSAESSAPKFAAQVFALTTRNYAGLRPATFRL
jgi:hypothetical protein